MQKTFWLQLWQDGQIGFHQSHVHPLLIAHINTLSLNQGDHILVPLCGKSLDMLYLSQQGFQVTGVELSEAAVQQFFVENGLVYEVTDEGGFVVYRSGNITLLQGDFFDLEIDFCQKFTAVYDRAALIALPDDMVGKYVTYLRKILPEGYKILLITLDYGQSEEMVGPPFSVDNVKVDQLFAQYANIELLNEANILEQEPKFKSRGCKRLIERAYLVSCRSK